MPSERPQINPYLFERQFEAFLSFTKEQTGIPFISFVSHPYTEKEEGYKYEVYKEARKALSFQTWEKSDIGSGLIISATIKAIETPKNNLISGQNRFGKHHQSLYEAQNNIKKQESIEATLFKLYREWKGIESLEELTTIFGKKYSLIAYLFFIKDRSKYLPIAPTFFDRAFELLGANFKTNRHCSWENYSTYLELLGDIKRLLIDALSSEVTLLDAHSFAWILSSQMAEKDKLADVREYLSLDKTEREAIVKARIGQGQFRKHLINYWSSCSVTNCTEHKLLLASHIKPWKESDNTERTDLYNGLLLSPNLDACFDSGFISFNDTGNIIISSQLSKENLVALGIHHDMRLTKIEPEHKKYLAYHRKNIFK
ncbi:MAG: HNH endonuclease [Chloroflexota bacterium]|nr:HNH endonuclease [Chloroflexota bacterium]